MFAERYNIIIAGHRVNIEFLVLIFLLKNSETERDLNNSQRTNIIIPADTLSQQKPLRAILNNLNFKRNVY